MSNCDELVKLILVLIALEIRKWIRDILNALCGDGGGKKMVGKRLRLILGAK